MTYALVRWERYTLLSKVSKYMKPLRPAALHDMAFTFTFMQRERELVGASAQSQRWGMLKTCQN